MADPRIWAVALIMLMAACGAAQARDANADEALSRAIRSDEPAAANAALAQKADPNRKLAFGAVPLSWAVETQDPAMVAALLAAKASSNHADAEGLTPLMLACELGNPAIISDLLTAGARVGAARSDGTSTLAICARYGPADAVVRMLAAGAKADSADSRGQTPLMWAAASGRTEAIGHLLKAGAGANRISKAGFTPLFFAIKSGALPAIEALIAARADTGYRGPEHTSALQLALYQHNFGAAALLAARGAGLAEHDRTGYQPLHVAAENGELALVDLLLAHGAEPNALTGPSSITWVTEANFGMAPPPVPPMTPLLLAAQQGHAPVMQRLLTAGANDGFIAADGTSLLLAAAKGQSAAALKLALTRSPDANAANPDGVTPLHLLVGGPAFPDLAAMLRLLAAHGARADLKTKQGPTAAEMAKGGRKETKAIFAEVFSTAMGNVQTPLATAPVDRQN